MVITYRNYLELAWQLDSLLPLCIRFLHQTLVGQPKYNLEKPGFAQHDFFLEPKTAYLGLIYLKSGVRTATT